MPAKNGQHSVAASSFAALADLTSEQIAAAAQESGEPAWLVEQRVQAWGFLRRRHHRSGAERISPNSSQKA